MVFPPATGSPMEPESPGSPPWLGLSTFSPTLRLDAAALSSTTSCVTRLQPRHRAGLLLVDRAALAVAGLGYAWRTEPRRSRDAKKPRSGTDRGWHCCIRLFERRWWLCDDGRLVVPPAASKSDCSRDDDGAGKKDTHGLAPTFLQNCDSNSFLTS